MSRMRPSQSFRFLSVLPPLFTNFHRLVFIMAVSMMGLATACAFDLAHVAYSPTSLAPSADIPNTVILTAPVDVRTPCSHIRTLKGGSKWEFAGKIPEGDVYKPLSQVLTVECSNIFEAYLVLSGRTLVGFYLPVERGYVSVKKPVPLPIP